MVREILIAHPLRLRFFGDRVINVASAQRIIHKLGIVLRLLRNVGLRNQNIQIVRRARHCLVAVIERLLQIACVLVVLGNLPVAVSHGRRIGRKLL